jgi:glycerol-3-phosphate dehydrogenase subunit C
MTVREGNLEAPTRHAIVWRSPEFYDEAACTTELGRIFEICHGCRRCVSLCNAFPTLFNMIDNGESGELDAVDRKDFAEVVDQCYLCDLCYMTKCPYTPPHPWNVDFPHTMLRAKAIRFRRGEVRLRDRLLSSTDALGKLASIPVVVQAVNSANRNGTTRRVLEATLGVKRERWLPEYDAARFRKTAAASAAHPVRDGERTPGKAALFATCYINYNEPGIGHDLVKLLDHNAIPHVLVEKEVCCGMPKLELGDLEGVARLKEINVPPLAKLAREGYALLAAIPSCALMFKSELPLLFPDDPDVRAVSDAMFDPCEYFVLRHRDGLLRTDFKTSPGRVSYHIPCHSRVQNIGRKTEELLKLAGAEVNTVERCSGHDGTWGVKKEYYVASMKIGRPVFKAMANDDPDYVSSDCAIAARHILQGMTEAGGAGRARKAHPLTLLRMAYGIE